MKYTIPSNTVVLHTLPFGPNENSRGKLMKILEHYTNVPANELRIVNGPKGKPALDPALGMDIHFNLSHSHGLIVYAFAHGFEVGVDIEKIRSMDRLLQIARRFFDNDELEMIQQSADPDTDFMRIWTKKEALTKAFGASVWDGLRERELLTVHHFTPEPGYMGCVVARSQNCNMVDAQA